MAITTDIKSSTLEIKGKRPMKKRKKPLPKQYAAPPGSAREKGIRRAAKLYKSGNKVAAFRLRNRMEAAEMKKKNGGKKNGKGKKAR